MKDYWDKRFLSEGLIWGEQPSKTAFHAKDLFSKFEVRTVLVPGAGYGRNTRLLSNEFEVDAIELSTEAVSLARRWDEKTFFMEGSILDSPVTKKLYDAVYCYDLLHLFTSHDRAKLIQRCMEQLEHAGIFYFTCFSDEDASFGMGLEIEKNTFEYKKGKIAHFFSDDDLRAHFKEAEIIETGSLEENFEYTSGGTRSYKLRYVVGKRPML